MDRESVLYEQLSMIDQVLSSGVDSYSTLYPELVGFLEDWLRTNSRPNTHPIRSVPLQESGAESIGYGANAPSPIRSSLLKHQTQMVLGMMAHCIRMQRGFVWQEQILRGKLGVIGDPPGSGKTLTVLAFLAAQAGIKAAEAALDRGWTTFQAITNRDVSGGTVVAAGGAGVATVAPAPPAAVAEPQYRMGELDVHSNRYVYSNDIEPVSDISACNLIVVPPTLLGHWRHETALHTTFAPFIVDGRRILRNRTTAEQMAASPFVLCTSKTYRYVLEYAEAQNIRWKHVFIDDAAGILLSNNDTLPTFEFLWLVTGNWLPFVLKNAHLHPVNLQYIRPRIALSAEGERWLADVLANERTVQPSLASSAFFRGVIPYNHKGRSALILRNSSAVLASANTSVPWEQGQTERVIQCMPTVTLAQLTPAFLASRGEQLVGQIPLLFQALGLHTLSVDELQMHHRERQGLLERKLNNDCSICLDAPQNRTILSCCMTPFCGACILRHTVSHPYGHSACPSCRTPIYVPSIVHVPTDTSDSAIVMNTHTHTSHHPTRSFTKQEALVDALVAAPQGSSFLVYSQFENTFYQVQPLLAERGIVAEQLTMPMARYQNTLRGYQDGRIHVLFVNDTSLIRGQNLQRSTHLVLFCEPAFYDTQQNLVHAVQRLGRTVPLTLLRLSSAL